MGLKRTSHAAYDTKYHLVWAPKYRKWILRGDLVQEVKDIFQEIAISHDFEIDTLEVAKDHVSCLSLFSTTVQYCPGGGDAEEHQRQRNLCQTPRSKAGTLGR